jgi:hypothetical protein
MPSSRQKAHRWGCPKINETDYHQDTKAPRKTKEFAFAVPLGIAFGDTRGIKKLGVLVPWW